MRIVVFGATGGTGRELVKQALAHGDEVTALVRDPGKLDVAHARLRVVTGDALDKPTVADVIVNQDGVMSALGTRPWRHVDVCSGGTAAILAGMRAHGLRRLVVLSTFGAGESFERAGWISRKLTFGLLLRRAIADKNAMEALIRACGLDWVIVRPVMLTSGAPTGRVRAVVDGSIHGGSIRRSDVAAFCLDQLRGNEFVRQAPVIAGA